MHSSPLSAAIQPYVDQSKIPGAVMFVADREGMLAVEPIGWADIEARKPMRQGTLFWVASQTKPVTAVAIMMLVDEGKLNLNDLVEKFIPQFAGLMYVAKKDDTEVLLRKPSSPITVKDTLLHTSGLPFKTAVEEPTLDLLPLETTVRSYTMAQLEFDPGTSILYSNAGFNTAGRIVELLSGMPYERFLDERIFRPLGMHDTTFWPDAEQTGNLAQSYSADPTDGHLVKFNIEQLRYPLSDTRNRFPMPAGGLFSTARDLAIFYRMMLNGGALDGRVYLTPESVRELTRRHTPESWDRAQGVGFMADGKTFSHGGAYGTHTLAHLETGLITGWLTQQSGFFGEAAGSREVFEKLALDIFSKTVR